ncbi:MAG: serine/threonine protein kinase [Pseudomonadales bacterium]|nr:serine/threonine protein kinase [Pseudomonadales bacterium]MCP5184341.1 serine/threonine protein kinase [Pseudomonadales bacterium]
MTTTPYASLTPDLILDALEAAGYEPSGGLTALNSYENRVYQAQMNDGSFSVVKFYRPGRWTDAQIREEHDFMRELVAAELPVVAPDYHAHGAMHVHLGFRFAVFPRQGGHTPDIEREDDLAVIARTLARLHAIGATRPFAHREIISLRRLGTASRDFVLQGNWLPLELETAYATLTAQLLERMRDPADEPAIRIHGDCHLGNMLWRNDTLHLVDFDDCAMGPPIQDIWMLLSGEREDRLVQLGTIADAYDMFHPFPAESLLLVETLRTLRILHHSAWIARRWDDPAFPLAFPTFDSARYWSAHVLELREQLAALDEPPLIV